MFINKINDSGGQIWSIQVIGNPTDDEYIKSIYPYSGSGCVIIYEAKGLGITHIYTLTVDGNGNVISGPTLISDLSGYQAGQKVESSSLVEDGIFISYRDDTSEDWDIYGQYIINGELMSGSSGIPIASGSYDQQSSSLAYNQNEGKVLVCYETSNGSQPDIHCREIQLSDRRSGNRRP